MTSSFQTNSHHQGKPSGSGSVVIEEEEDSADAASVVSSSFVGPSLSGDEKSFIVLPVVVVVVVGLVFCIGKMYAEQASAKSRARKTALFIFIFYMLLVGYKVQIERDNLCLSRRDRGVITGPTEIVIHTVNNR
jgi:hypothetical protein